MSIDVLLIDDDALDRKAVVRALRKAGWDGALTECTDAEGGLDTARGTAPGCILLDYRLPDADGIEVLEKLIADETVDAPVIMLTGQGSEALAVQAMKAGASDYLPKAEIRADTLFRALTQAVERHSLARELERARNKIEQMALYDSLTGLGNRHLFNRQLASGLAAAARHGLPLCLFVMDLDRFKAVNDTFGHEAGDHVLAEVGQRLRALGREEDEFFRLGGDEFAAILRTGVSPEGVRLVAQRIDEEVSKPIVLPQTVANIGVSIGAALFPAAGRTPEQFLRTADLAMYDAKRAKRGFVLKETPADADDADGTEDPPRLGG